MTEESSAVSAPARIIHRLGSRPSMTDKAEAEGRPRKVAHRLRREPGARPRSPRSAVLGLALLAALIPAVNAASAQAAKPWWGLDTSSRPAAIPPGGEGTLVLRASNLGDAPTASRTVEPEGEPPFTVGATSSLELALPEGTSVVESEGVPQVSFWTFREGFDAPENLGPTGEGLKALLGRYCEDGPRTVTCRTEAAAPFNQLPLLGMAPLAPYELFEMRVKVKDEGAPAGARFEASVSGGGAATVSHSRALPIGGAAARFGAESYELRPEAEGGALDPRSGAHPYQLSATFNLNQEAELRESEILGVETDSNSAYVAAPAPPRNLAFALPPGQLGNATAVPQCSAIEFAAVQEGGSENLCPQDSVIGVATITFDEPNHLGLSSWPVPLFNLAPAFGEPARFGFEFQQTPVILDTSLRSGPGEDYGVTVSVHNISQLVNFVSSTVTFWGVPGDPSHDESRGWTCLANGFHTHGGRNLPCLPEGQSDPPAFLTTPTDCLAPFVTSATGESWASPGRDAQAFAPFPGADPFTLTACNQLPFDPQVHSEPTNAAATSPTGLSFDLDFEDEGLTSGKPGARAESQMKRAVVELPAGLTANPSVAEGLAACSEAEYESATVEAGSGCKPESKVGEVEITSPLVAPSQVVKGGLYVARQGENPSRDAAHPGGNLLTLYLIAREPEIGVVIRQALKVTPNPVTGQLTTEVDNAPQLPFSHLHLFFRPGQRAPLITPPACGTYTVEATMYPWSNPGQGVQRESSFQVTSGPEGQGCPSGGTPPFHPTLLAGSENPSAGAYSPFYTEISRRDSEQEITHFSIKLPPGELANLSGVAKCSDAQVAAAKAREREGGGQEELSSPSCPAASEVGHTTVGTGVGNVLAYAPGKLYLAGPYQGSQLSLVSITAAKVGPFDLGTVVVRFALRIDPTTAVVSVDGADSDPIPHIVDGIPVHLRDIQAFVDRPRFSLNPTNCTPTSTASTVLGSGTNFASEADDQPVTVTSPFQVGNCASLGFKPKLALKLSGPTKRAGLPKLKAVVTYPKGGSYANIAKTVVTLPPSEFLEQGHIGSSCTRVQFNSGAGNGAGCPKNSLLGHAKAITPLLEEPIEGNVYLRSNGGERKLPDLVAALHSKDIDINLVGFISSLHKKGSEVSQIRNTFAAVPDAPVERFTLELFGGKKGLLVNSTNICKGTHRAISEFTGQNGKLYDTEPAVQAQCGKKGKGKKSKGGKGSGKHGKGR
jgi:hypothetical protein